MIQLTPNDLPVGHPLPWSLLDGDGNLVLGSGSVIPDARDLALVFRHGVLCRAGNGSDSDDGDHSGDTDADTGARAMPGPLGLQVGTLLHIKHEGESARAAASRLIGFIEQGLFVTWPQLGGRDLPLQAGDTVLLRGFSGQAIHSFTSTITAVCRSPFRYLVLSAPTNLHATPVRKAARVPTRLAAYLTEPPEDDDGDHGVSVAVRAGTARLALLSDLSTGGALVQTTAPSPAPGSRVRLRFQLRAASFDSEVIVDGWVRAAPGAIGQEDGDFPAFGVAFDLLAEREMALLQCYIYEQLLSTTRLPL
ncbi:flagellar brake protein [Cupriavidus consociatus]|uniref:flagellar brake protein n=1 Tax=Cupriavidus consociatus TaxID=2821357 RepID=UPI001AE6DC96|nr:MULTISPECIES: flagellar brake protein [unclassified Cupriavidus]MBP0620418.1 flagellar brake protein [Cupriavidus sp. LEh25]MDK2657075.1 flagellar brake protein [Cupriavidus sp. LEh21]